METLIGASLARGFSENVKRVWPLVRAADCITLNYGKALPEPIRRAGEVPVFGSNGICGYHDTSLADPPGLVLGRKGQGPLGVKWSDRPFWVIDTAYFARVDSAILDMRFAYYLIGYIGLNHMKDGTSNPSLTRERFGCQALPAPPLADQRRITSALVAYDDLIGNNMRRIGVLEEMARVLYREWFVRPTAKNALHAGWERKTFGQLASLRKESVRPGDEPETEYDLFSFEARDLGSLPIETFGKTIQSSKFIVPEGVVLLPKLNPHIPRVWLPFLEGDRPKICSTEFLVLHPSPRIPRSFLYAMVEDGSFSAGLAQRADGTSNSHKRLKPDDVLAQPVVLPPRDLLGRFDDFATGVFEKCHLLRKKNRALRAARDLLLPKLLSGELSVDRIPDPAEVAL